MFNTGRRTIFDVCRGHVGHSIEMLPIEEEGVVKGIKVYCRTCSEALIVQETEDWSVREEISIRKSRRLGAMSYEQWEDQHHREMSASHADDCGCEGGYWECQEGCGPYEGSELDQFYNEYLDGIAQPQRQTPSQSARLWDVNESDTWTT